MDAKRDRSVVIIVKNLTDKQASKLVTKIIDEKSRIAQNGRGTVRKERYGACIEDTGRKQIKG